MEKRTFIQTKINNRLIKIEGEKSFQTLATYLRSDLDLYGTKIVCAEGDCGACTVLVGREVGSDNKLIYKSVNSCILPLYLIDGAHVITVEGLESDNELHEVQKKMIDCHGSQCGYCTPGFICSMAYMTEKLKSEGKDITEKRAKNYLTGNLCRCTGYQPIISAATRIDLDKVEFLKKRYFDKDYLALSNKIKSETLVIASEHFNIVLPTSIEEAILIKALEPKLKLVAGNTDLGVVTNKGRGDFLDVMSLIHIDEMKKISSTADHIIVGGLVTLTEFEDYIEAKIPELKNLLHIFASPQIKNQGTLVGNVINASPIGDTIPFLMSSDAIVMIDSVRGIREVVLKDFYKGYKQLDLAVDEIVVGVKVPRLKATEKMSLFKVSMRKDLDISAVTFAGVLELDKNKIKNAKISFGGVGPTVLRMNAIEKKLIGSEFSEELFHSIGEDIASYISPLSDLRASKEYRLMLAKNFIKKFYVEVGDLQ